MLRAQFGVFKSLVVQIYTFDRVFDLTAHVTAHVSIFLNCSMRPVRLAHPSVKFCSTHAQ